MCWWNFCCDMNATHRWLGPSDGSIVRNRDFGSLGGGSGRLYAVAIGSDGSVYVAGDSADDGAYTIQKYSAARLFQWSFVAGSRIRGLAVGASGNVYAVGDRSASTDIWALDSDGNQLWTADHGAGLFCCCLDSSENLYVGGNPVSGSNSIRKYDSSGNLLLSYSTGGTTSGGVVVDGSGNVYAGGAGPHHTRKYDTAGTVVWTHVSGGGQINAVAIDPLTSDIFSVTGAVGVGRIFRYDSATGNDVLTGWPKDHNTFLNGIDIDGSGNVYVTGSRASSITTRKYDNAGNLLWTFDHGDATFDIAIKDGVLVMCGARVAT